MIINLTQHPATPEQIAAGVVDLPPQTREDLRDALTFDALPESDELFSRAAYIAELAAIDGAEDGMPTAAMIGGAPYLMAPLERALHAVGIQPIYAFSVRDSREEPDGQGGVRKVAVFRHVGFVPASEAEMTVQCSRSTTASKPE